MKRCVYSTQCIDGFATILTISRNVALATVTTVPCALTGPPRLAERAGGGTRSRLGNSALALFTRRQQPGPVEVAFGGHHTKLLMTQSFLLLRFLSLLLWLFMAKK
jgi:hypothetical protein